MNIRQAVTFCILMQSHKGIVDSHPSYLWEKLKTCEGSSVPEVILDSFNQVKFNEYKKKFDFKWNTDDDLRIPMNEFDKKTGEPK